MQGELAQHEGEFVEWLFIRSGVTVVCLFVGEREKTRTNTHVPVWAGLFDVFMIRACSLRNCSISDLRSTGRNEEKTI